MLTGWPTLCRVLKTNCNCSCERKQLVNFLYNNEASKIGVSSVKLAILYIETKNENLLQIVKKRFVFRTYDFLRPTKFKRNT